MVFKISSDFGVCVKLSSGLVGHVFHTDIYDDYELLSTDPLNHMKLGTIVQCKVLSITSSTINLSMRPSLTLPAGTTLPYPIKDSYITSLKELEKTPLVRGFIRDVSKKGIFVGVNSQLSGRVLLRNMCERNIEIDNIPKALPVGHLVQARILTIDEERGYFDLSLRKCDILNQEQISYEKIEIGQKFTGFIKSIRDFGLLISFKKNPRIVGICPTKETSDVPEDLNSAFEIGDYVKFVVLSKLPEKKQVRLSLRASHFTEEDMEDSDDESEAGNAKAELAQSPFIADNFIDPSLYKSYGQDEVKAHQLRQQQRKSALEKQMADDEDDEDAIGSDAEEDIGDPEDEDFATQEIDVAVEEVDDEDEDDDQEEVTKTSMKDKKKDKKKAKKTTEAEFAFDDFAFSSKPKTADQDDESDASSDSDSDEDSEVEEKTVTRREKKKARIHQYKDTTEIEADLADDDASNPETAADFERLLISEPQNSQHWIRYMAFLISIAELDKARLTVEKALKKINAENAADKLNIWNAFLNLEFAYGSPTTLEAVIKRAITYNEPKDIFIRLIEMYLRADEVDQAEAIAKKLVSKYRTLPEAWSRYGQLLIEYRKDSEAASSLLQRASLSLGKKEHIQLVSKFASMEYQAGNIEVGRTLMEGILSNYPKRNDLWAVYVDMETAHGKSTQFVRSIFERAATLNLSSKKMKSIFKKYLQFEKTHGNADTIQHVKQQALSYLRTKEGQA
eukprot:TRINITY_DN1372_c0_g1_i5.p1 TRINITY_DN1372_c0_g1~~TRINITY_DN1372_c0_g1_i5.p1  ORF type:complete len:734 (-),score=465.38 TRINITY_DN1372_c0_g1_i5:155-2356(-)